MVCRLRTVYLSDLLRALPGVLLFGLLPGLALAALILPRVSRAIWVAAAPGLSIGVVGIWGLALDRLHVRFGVATVLPMIVALILIALLRLQRSARLRPLFARPPRDSSVLYSVALLSGLAVAATVVIAFRDVPLPVYLDSPVHSQFATQIQRTGSVDVVVRTHVAAEATAAMVADVTGLPPAKTMLPLGLLSIAVFGVGMAWLYRATGIRNTALCTLFTASLASMAYITLFGDFPYLTDIALVAPLTAALVSETRQHDWAWLIFIFACVAAIWATHVIEVITVCLLFAAIFAVQFLNTRRLPFWRLLICGAAGAAGYLLVGALTRHPTIGFSSDISTASANQLSDVTPSSGVSAGGVVGYFLLVFLPPLVGGFVFLLGAAEVLRRRAALWPLIVSVVLILIFIDVRATGYLTRVWLALYPWESPDRLVEMQVFVAPALMGAGTAVLGALLARRRFDPRVFAAVIATGITIFGLVTTTQIEMAVIADHGVVTEHDIAVMTQAQELLPAGARVLNDGEADAGLWLPSFANVKILLDKSVVDPYPDEPRLVALANTCKNPAQAQVALVGADAVFVGELHAKGAFFPWNASCIAKIPNLELIAHQGNAALFRVVH